MRPLWEQGGGGGGCGGGGREIRSACLLTRPHVLMACLLFSPFSSLGPLAEEPRAANGVFVAATDGGAVAENFLLWIE